MPKIIPLETLEELIQGDPEYGPSNVVEMLDDCIVELGETGSVTIEVQGKSYVVSLKIEEEVV